MGLTLPQEALHFWLFLRSAYDKCMQACLFWDTVFANIAF